MRKIGFLLILLAFACKNASREDTMESSEPSTEKNFSAVDVQVILENDSLSVRAIDVIGKDLAFAGNHGIYGLYNSADGTWKTNIKKFDSLSPEYRAIGSTSTDFFMLSVGSPALLYKTGDSGKMELVYKEDHEKAFYDAMAFWNDNEGIAIGDPTGDCMSIIVTRNGGKSWTKLECDVLPLAADGEAAFAASNSNISIQGNKTWILTGGMKSRILFSPDKGKSWEIYSTPIVQGTPTTGGYSLDFYDDNQGFIIGGDYTNPEGNNNNKAVTTDGGKTWTTVANGEEPGYKSSVRYVPNSNARQLIATGFTGIDYSKDGGNTWEQLSPEGFYTLRFVNDSLAYAAGKGRIARLNFR